MDEENLFYKITEEINDLFDEFTSLGLEINPANNQVSLDNILNYESFLFDRNKQMEKHIRTLFLHGKDLYMDKLLQLLKKAKDINSRVNYGFVFTILNKGKEGKPIKVEQEVVKALTDVKLRTIDNLIDYVRELRNCNKPNETNDISNFRIKPIFKPEAIPIIFDLLKDFFEPEQQIQLKQLLETGNNLSSKLLFKDKGNRLTDTFKKLWQFDFIPGCQKKVLQEWIIQNFTFLKLGLISSFKAETVEKSISKNTYHCQCPIIEIRNGQIIKAEQPRQKRYKN